MNAEVQFLVDRVRGDFRNEEGLVSQHYPPQGRHLLLDCEDYLPFMAYFGEVEFTAEQVRLGVGKTVRGLVPNHGRVNSWRQNEWLGAVYGEWRRSRAPELADVIGDGVRFLEDRFIDGPFIRAFVSLASGRSPRIFDSRTGALLETLLDTGEDFPTARWMALNCLDGILEWSAGSGRHVVPNFIPLGSRFAMKITRFSPLRRPSKVVCPYAENALSGVADLLMTLPFREEIKLAKQNTNLMHAFLRAYALTGEVRYLEFVKRWRSEFREGMYDRGRCYTSPGKKVVRLSHNHPVIDICLELHRQDGDAEALQMGVEIAEFWVTQRLGSGLFPSAVGASTAHLDGQTDMIVVLVKLAGLLGDKRYLELAWEVLQAIVRHHRTAEGYVTRAGNGRDMTPGSIEPKYNALLLKAFIALERSKEILDEELWLLLRDR